MPQTCSVLSATRNQQWWWCHQWSHQWPHLWHHQWLISCYVAVS